MKQLLVLSGKGGTGKTTVSSALIQLSQARAFADCDVDAPNLHLLLAGEGEPQREDYWGLPKAAIDPALCLGCGLCREACRFDAIQEAAGQYTITPFACEGCALCSQLCPAGAITMSAQVAGEMMLKEQAGRVFSTAKLRMGSGTSGKLVTQVKQRMVAHAPKETELAIIDGSPGIGCPVIASISGAALVLVVTEPSLSGLSDLQRIVRTATQFRAKLAVCINKYDTNLPNTERIEAYCQEQGLPVLGRIPFDETAALAINQGLTVVEMPSAAGEAITQIYQRILVLMGLPTKDAADLNKGDD